MAITVKKVYPIKGRSDFYKYVVMDNGKIAKGLGSFGKTDEPMYFDKKDDADRVAKARREVIKIEKKWATGKTTKK